VLGRLVQLIQLKSKRKSSTKSEGIFHDQRILPPASEVKIIIFINHRRPLEFVTSVTLESMRMFHGFPINRMRREELLFRTQSCTIWQVILVLCFFVCVKWRKHYWSVSQRLKIATWTVLNVLTSVFVSRLTYFCQSTHSWCSSKCYAKRTRLNVVPASVTVIGHFGHFGGKVYSQTRPCCVHVRLGVEPRFHRRKIMIIKLNESKVIDKHRPLASLGHQFVPRWCR